ncbi:hypothetical protein [Novosphingobium aquae]|uniref:Adenylate cyclase n=1 Tax=Novosphingobium aquae TaxID=3133435 RepID=A0ABU8S6M7_9SPHN
MDQDRPTPEAMRAELAAVLASPAFARSPVLSRLLGYLVDESIAGRAERLKSYTVAVDGLGRESGHDPQLDTYSRVAMVRLRRALDTFYQTDPRASGQRLNIPLGSYKVVLENAAEGETAPGPELENALAARPLTILRRYRWPILMMLLACALFAGQWLYNRSLIEAATWQQTNFPNVLVRLASPAGASASPEEREIADSFREAIRPYEAIRLAHAMTGEVTYLVDLQVKPGQAGGRIVRIEVTSLKRNRVTYQAEVPVSAGQPDAASRLALGRAAYAIFGYSGQIESLESRNSVAANSPYDCWLRFSQQVRTDPMYDDPELSECTRRWHEHAPQRPVAVAIFAWSEMNAALAPLASGSTESKLRDTLKLLERARARYPESRHIALALARNYALLGYRESVHETVKGLRASAGSNPDLINLAGMFMILQNDLSGEALVDESIAFHPDPPARYFLGKFLVAMMRDDVGGAGKALDRVLVENRTSVWGQVFQAAYLARSGNVPAAKAAWKLAINQRPALGISPRIFIAASPASPEIEARLLAWLGPVIE